MTTRLSDWAKRIGLVLLVYQYIPSSPRHGAFHITSLSCMFRPAFLFVSVFKNINQFFPFYIISTSSWMTSKTFNCTHDISGKPLAAESYSFGFNRVPSFIYSCVSLTRLKIFSFWLFIYFLTAPCDQRKLTSTCHHQIKLCIILKLSTLKWSN